MDLPHFNDFAKQFYSQDPTKDRRIQIDRIDEDQSEESQTNR